MHLDKAYTIAAYVTSSFIPHSRDETIACFHSCLNSVVPLSGVNSPADELFAGIRGPVLIRISSFCDMTVNLQISVIFSVLLNVQSDLRSCF